MKLNRTMTGASMLLTATLLISAGFRGPHIEGQQSPLTPPLKPVAGTIDRSVVDPKTGDAYQFVTFEGGVQVIAPNGSVVDTMTDKEFKNAKRNSLGGTEGPASLLDGARDTSNCKLEGNYGIPGTGDSITAYDCQDDQLKIFGPNGEVTAASVKGLRSIMQQEGLSIAERKAQQSDYVQEALEGSIGNRR